ncbi:MAG: TolC family protein [Planctomycetes bacterium]|nr:TolC family protein [Planctomycetota bacterium]
MNRQIRSSISLTLCALLLSSGCKPIQPFFFQEDGNLLGKGDLSHYMDLATDIEYPDVNEPTLDEVHAAQAPLTIANAEDFVVWDLTLEEVTRITLTNSQVIRQLGGRISDGGSNIAGTTPETLQNNPAGAITTYDPALVESGNGTATGSQLSGTGVEAALSEFDAVLDSSITWQRNDRPQNFRTGGAFGDFFANNFQQETGNYTMGLTKASAQGTIFELRNNTLYDGNNNGSRATPSDWFTNFEAAVTQPLLQGAGTQVNRITGPQTFQQAAGGLVNQIDGVMISRIRHDITLTDFEAGVRNLMRDVEDAYWELYFTYRDLEARKIGRDSSLETWRKVKALQRVGGTGGEADKEAQARSQYFLFRTQVESALTNLFRVENRLRYMMGIAMSDSRLIRPIDEPTTAQIHFDWPTIHSETLARRSELRRQKWQVKRRELELIATRNNLLPRLDAVGRYRWVGAGDALINSNATGIGPFAEGSNAFESLVSGRYQEWQMGFQFSMPIGFRRALSGVRHHQLLLARERAVLQDLELEFSHQLGDAIRDLDLNFGLTQSNFNRRVAAEDEVEAVEAVYDSGRVTFDLLLDTQRRRAEAESAYYRSLVDYNRAIMRVHFRKGSLLEYNGVYLAEGPWPGKAQFDALRRARQRDASTYLDYGYTRPNVISRGPHAQITEPYAPAANQPTPAYDGPVLQETAPFEKWPSDQHPLDQQPLDGAPVEGEQPNQEIIPPPEDIQVTMAPMALGIRPQEYSQEYSQETAADPNLAVVVANLPALPAAVPASLPVVSPAYVPAYTPPVVPIASADVSAAIRQPVPKNEEQTPLHANPYRQEIRPWMHPTTVGLPSGTAGVNSLRSSPNTQFTTSWSADRPLAAPPVADESQTHYTPLETAPDSTVWPGPKR